MKKFLAGITTFFTILWMDTTAVEGIEFYAPPNALAPAEQSGVRSLFLLLLHFLVIPAVVVTGIAIYFVRRKKK